MWKKILSTGKKMNESNNYFEHKYKENRYKNVSFSGISSEI